MYFMHTTLPQQAPVRNLGKPGLVRRISAHSVRRHLGEHLLKIKIEVDGEVAELADDEIIKEFTWHNMRDSNHCRRVRRKIFEAVLAFADPAAAAAPAVDDNADDCDTDPAADSES
jgi:hypothetical protein